MIQKIKQTSKIAESSNTIKKIHTKCALCNVIGGKCNFIYYKF